MKDDKHKPRNKCLWRGGGTAACQQDEYHDGEHDPEAYSTNPSERHREVQAELKVRTKVGWRHDVEPSKERKQATRKRKALRDERRSEAHKLLDERGTPKRHGGSKLGLRKRMRLAGETEDV